MPPNPAARSKTPARSKFRLWQQHSRQVSPAATSATLPARSQLHDPNRAGHRDFRDRVSPDLDAAQAGSSEMFGASPPPQNEKTSFYPRSPYAVSKSGSPLVWHQPAGGTQSLYLQLSGSPKTLAGLPTASSGPLDHAQPPRSIAVRRPHSAPRSNAGLHLGVVAVASTGSGQQQSWGYRFRPRPIPTIHTG